MKFFQYISCTLCSLLAHAGGECGSGDDGGDASVDGVSVVAPLEVPMHLHLRRRPHIGLGFVRSVMMMMMMVMTQHDYQ